MRYADLDQESKDLIAECLTERQQQVIKLRLNESSWRQISDILSIDPTTAREHYAAAIRKLRKAMEVEKVRAA